MQRFRIGRNVRRWRSGSWVGPRLAAAIVSILVAGAVWPATAIGAGPEVPSDVTDITWTGAGRALAQQAAGRYARLAAAIAAGDLVVLRDSTGITIGPRDATYSIVPTVGRSGRPQVEVLPTTIGRSAATKASRRFAVAAIAGVSWTMVANQCFSRISDTFSWLDHCYTMYRLANDMDGGRDWYALNHYATMQANQPWVMNAASIGTSPVGSTPQVWADWAPRSDLAGTCRQIILSIFAPVGGIWDTASQCEVWSISKSATPGVFSVKWDGRGQKAARELSMLISVSVPQNGWPQWSLPAWVSGSPF